jgi:hypothetical protein
MVAPVGTADEPSRLGHPAVLVTVAASLLAIGVVLWILGYLETGRHNGDRLAELGAGIVGGALVSFAFLLVDRAGAERDRRREIRDRERHDQLIKRLGEARGQQAPSSES